MLAFQAHPRLGALSGHARALNADHNVLTRMQDVWYDGQFGVAKAAESVFALGHLRVRPAGRVSPRGDL